MVRQPRQRPISCHFCRSRKLRCGRNVPCSNCSSRGLPCSESQDPPRQCQSGVTKKPSSSLNSNADILSRLERLEALLSDRDKHPETASAPPQVATVWVVDAKTEVPASQQPSPPQPLSSNVLNLTADALFLERQCLGPKLSDSVPADRITFRVCPISTITASSSTYIFEAPIIPSSSLSFEPTKCIWLPQKDEVKFLIDKYLLGVSHIRNIVHGPSLQSVVDHVYDSFQQGTEISVGYAVLLLSICADVTYSWTSRDGKCALFSSSEEANSQAFFWLKEGFDLMEHSQHGAHVSIELIQGILLLSFVLCNMEGVSVRVRAHIAKTITLARELGLHRLDHPNNGHLAQVGRSEIKTEVGRRVWWYLAATDWLMARFPGPHEGTYNINPQHMAVKKPLNINDDSLVDGELPISLPMEEPTGMSYFLQRLRLAELSRSFVDTMSLAKTDPCSLGYDLVQELDDAIDRLMRELPAFFNTEYSELRQLPLTDPRRSPSVIVQRHVLNLFVHGQRCKLHLPYLVRGTVDAAYAHSREMCLKTAGTIVDMEHQLENEGVPFVATRLRLSMAMHSVFIAAIAFMIDLCLIPNEDKTMSRARMAQVWRILEDASEHSPPASKLKELLGQIMKKYKVSLPTSKSRVSESMEGGWGGVPPLTPASGTNPGLPAVTSPENPIFAFPELVNLESGMDLDGINWESILWNLDTSIM